MARRLRTYVAVAALWPAAAWATNAVAELRAEVADLRAKTAKLEQANRALREENQQLRRLLVGDGGTDAPPPGQGGSVAQPEGEGGYWISTRSGVRHNSRCKNFRRTRGRECGKDEGRPCGICGG